MGHIAYRLRDEYQGEPATDPDTGEETDERIAAFEGGVIGVPPRGDRYDVGKALDKGDGLIVVADTETHLVNALDSYDALERTDVPDAAAAGYAGRTVAQLREEAGDRQIEGVSKHTKDELVAVLERHDELVAAGDPDAAAKATQTPED